MRSGREGQISYQLHVESKKKKGTNEHIYKIGKKKSYRCRKQSYGCHGRKGEGMSWKAYKVCVLTGTHCCAVRTAAKSRLTLLDSTACSLPGSPLCPWGFPGKNAQLSCHFLPQGILLIQGSNSHLLHQWADSLTTEPPGKPAHTPLYIK